jgi:hypothetical protein
MLMMGDRSNCVPWLLKIRQNALFKKEIRKYEDQYFKIEKTGKEKELITFNVENV